MKITVVAASLGALLLAEDASLPWAGAQTTRLLKAQEHRQSPVVFEGGDGTSCERAVLIKGARGELEGVASEYRWLSEHYPGWNLTEQSLVQSSERSYDVLNFTTADARKQSVCFDISEFFQQ